MRDPVAESLRLSALDCVAFGAPAQHAAGEIGNIAEARALQHERSLCGTRARTTHGDDRPLAWKLGRARRELPERNELRALNAAKRAVIFVGLAHVDDLDVGSVLLECIRLDFPDAGERESEWRPARLGRQGGVFLGTSAPKIRGHRDVDEL